MLRRAAAELQLDLSVSYVVGDQAIDMELAAHVGAKGVWIHGGSRSQAASPQPSYVAADLWEAARWVIGNRDTDRSEEG
jgi:histidinol phosphatase-like enzyme